MSGTLSALEENIDKLQQSQIRFDLLFKYLDLMVKVQKYESHIQVVEILGLKKKKLI